MDYHRIYFDFIKDRRAKEPSLEGYVERHHILPRSLGGGDKPQNLIRLTPEDHYFAHLLLAKMHGGSQWRALHAMAYLLTKGTEGGRSKLSQRFNFGHVRRSLADHYRQMSSGPDAPMADQRFYEMRNADGRILLGRRFYLERRSGVPRQQISALLRGTKKTAHGWYVPMHNPEGLTRSEQISRRVRDNTVHTLYHFDGRTWAGTFHDFRAMTGCQLTWQGANHKTIKGWYLSKDEADQHRDRLSEKGRNIAARRGNISGEKNPRHDGTLYEFWNHISKERRSCTRHQLCIDEGIAYGDMSAVFSGRQQSAKGWTLWSRRDEKFRRPSQVVTLKKGSDIVSGSRADIAKALGEDPEKVSYGLYAMRIGKTATYKGWSIVEPTRPGREKHQVV